MSENRSTQKPRRDIIFTSDADADEWVSLYSSRNDLAWDYLDLLRTLPADSLTWKVLNEAIVRRWSLAGLRYIKEKAWKIARATT